MTTRRVMVDIETLGLDHDSAILSIGACRFSPGAGVFGKEFYTEIDIRSCREHGLTVDDETFDWWYDNHSDIAPLDGDETLPEALERFSLWLKPFDEIWANSPCFDCEILEHAYSQTEMDVPWEYYQERDVRTIRSTPLHVELENDGREHHALDDAKHQAREVAATLEAMDE